MRKIYGVDLILVQVATLFFSFTLFPWSIHKARRKEQQRCPQEKDGMGL